MSSVYKRLQSIRVKLQESGLKKSGRNKFADYTYFELEDFIPAMNRMFEADGLCSTICYDSQLATLMILDVDKPEDRAVFTIPMSTAALKGCHEVQNLGAVVSYIRRYLYTIALEIVESDALDKTHGNDALEKHNPAPYQKPAPKVQPIDLERLVGVLASMNSVKELESEYKSVDFQARLAVSDKAAVNKAVAARKAALVEREAASGS